jgi:hypothetical protein
MELNEQIAILAFELYENSGRIEGRDLDNWLEAERIIKARQQEATKIEEQKKTELVEKDPVPVG